MRKFANNNKASLTETLLPEFKNMTGALSKASATSTVRMSAVVDLADPKCPGNIHRPLAPANGIMIGGFPIFGTWK